MIAFVRLVNRFRSDERGVFAVIFGLLAVVLIALAGAVVDLVSLEQTRNRAQVALDAAALALQHEIFNLPLNTTSIKAKAQALMIERINDTRFTANVDAISVDVVNGSLLLQAKLSMPTIFVALVGVKQMDARIFSEATRKKLTLEVAMVLDNSGSMANSNRMTSLKEAATCATYIMFYSAIIDATCLPAVGATLIDKVKVGVVPFTMFVNVDPGNASAAWIDKTGASSIANDNFDTDDDDTTAPTG